MSIALVLGYDRYHVPLDEVCAALPYGTRPVVLSIRLGDAEDLVPEAGTLCAYDVMRVDARVRFAREILSRAIKANACYQDGYYLSAALARPLTASICVERAISSGARMLVHGLAGNDCLRFTAGMRTLAPEIELVSVRALCGSRTAANPDEYTVSENLWGQSVEAGDLGDPACPGSLEDVSVNGHATPARLEISFEAGIPVALDGLRLPLAEFIGTLNRLGSARGIGVTDLVEDGYVGLKTRGRYTAPAATMLIAAHKDLERFVCSRHENRFKRFVDNAWSELVYDGFWFDPAREALERYIDFVNERVTGTVTLALGSGAARPIARSSRNAIYDERHAVYRAGQDFGAHMIDELATEHSLAARLARNGETLCSA